MTLQQQHYITFDQNPKKNPRLIQMYHANEKPRMLMLTTNLITERQPVVQSFIYKP
jgi:hypothetical protein